MNLSLHCPSCSRAIATIDQHTSQITCSHCRSRFGFVYGKLSRRSSLFETLLYLNGKLPSFYKRYYNLQITTPDRVLKRLQFSLPGKTDDLPVYHGDLISVLYTMQGYVMKKLVAITNHTTGKRYVLPNPIPSPRYLMVMVSASVLGLLMFTYISGGSMFLAASVSALGVLLYWKLTHTAQLTSPPLEEQGGEGSRLLADQKLLMQKQRIAHRLDEVNHESRSNQALIQQIEHLKQKMLEVDQQLYGARIHRATSAIGILKRQIANNQRLMREYRRALRMIEIEVETSWIADQLPDAENFTRVIVQKLQELKQIEDQNQFLKLQLAAYEEVNHLGIPSYE